MSFYSLKYVKTKISQKTFPLAADFPLAVSTGMIPLAVNPLAGFTSIPLAAKVVVEVPSTGTLPVDHWLVILQWQWLYMVCRFYTTLYLPHI
jgi:hypothetical protein